MNGFLNGLLLAALAVLVPGIAFGLIRAIIGPRRADRILGINMIGSLSIAAIAVSSILLSEPWLLDVCLVYCLISFLAVVVLAKVHIEQKQEEKNE